MLNEWPPYENAEKLYSGRALKEGHDIPLFSVRDFPKQMLDDIY